MITAQRTPFGELVFTLRNNLNLTQRELASLASNPPNPTLDYATVSERTVSGIERIFSPGDKTTQPRMSTVKALAIAFNLEPGSAGYRQFLAAAKAPIMESPTASGFHSSASTAAVETRPLFVPNGRERQIERLQAAVLQAAGGQPAVVFVSAAAGTGKTALISEIARQALDGHDDAVVLWGECTGRSTASDTYQPIRQVTGVLVGDVSAAGPLQLVSRVNQRRIMARSAHAIDALTKHGPGLIGRLVTNDALRSARDNADFGPDAISRINHAIETIGAPDISTEGFNEQVFRVLAAYAERGLTMIVLEDLHWADSGSLSLLFHVLRRLRDQRLPILLVGSFRPTPLDSATPGDPHPFMSILNESHRLFQDPLLDLSTSVGGEEGRAFVDAMVARSIEEAPTSFVETLFEQTAGLPLFVQGMLRMYRTTGSLGEDEHGRTVLTSIPGPDTMPSEINALFAEQIRQLPPELQHLLKVASVQGSVFVAEVMGRILGIGETELIHQLDDQLRRQFHLVAPGRTISVHNIVSHTYQFEHSLLRDYVHSQLAGFERGHYHTITAEAMLESYGDGQHEMASNIAFHFDQANNRAKAARAYIAAGDHAMDRSEFDLATSLFARVGELKVFREDPYSTAQALVGMGNCARAKGDAASAATYLNQAFDLAKRRGVRVVEANCLTSLGMLDYDAGRMHHGAERLGQAVAIHLELGNLREGSRSLSLRALMLHGQGLYDDAEAVSRQAIDFAQELGDDMLLVSGKIALANCLLELGMYDEANFQYEEAIALCEEHGNIHRKGVCQLNMVLCEIERGDHARARTLLDAVFQNRHRFIQRMVGVAECLSGMIAEHFGNTGEAEACYQRSLEIRTRLRQDALIIDSLAGLLRVALTTNASGIARAQISEITERFDANGGFEGIEHPVRLCVTMIRAHLQLGNPAIARMWAERGLQWLAFRVDHLADHRHRTSLIHNIPIIQRLLDSAEEMGIRREAIPSTE